MAIERCVSRRSIGELDALFLGADECYLNTRYFEEFQPKTNLQSRVQLQNAFNSNILKKISTFEKSHRAYGRNRYKQSLEG